MLLHLGRYTSVDAALEEWPKVRRFASQHWHKVDRLRKEERSFKRTLETHLEGARKAEKLADEIAAKLKKLHDLKDQGGI